ncbi:MAG: hypothetical protein A2Y25_02755 [Candidatus Melainabacteria bacterium GWF2_37_15]|nr:MAG: hypothetical protein A2Y25_02755 [Candidatus Melainabacteria bacterium GWF2_37_15]
MDFTILGFIIVGFVAQLLDGCLGMAYGVISTTFLTGIGIPAAAASASVHTSEIFTTAVSGFSHFKFENIDKELVKKLLIPGVIGGIIGAYILTAVPGDKIKPFVTVYLLIMGIVIVAKAFKNQVPKEVKTKIVPLGFIGGFFDAIGGGGWGPIVTSTLVARGNCPRYTIGSVNFSEFFVTVAQSVTFFLTIGLTHWKIILGLLLGGVVAAPFAAFSCKKLPHKPLMVLVGLLIIILNLRTLIILYI